MHSTNACRQAGTPVCSPRTASLDANRARLGSTTTPFVIDASFDIPAGLRDLLWEPAHLYPPGIAGSVRIKGGPVSPGYEAELVATWGRVLPELAAHVRVPVRYTLGEFERVWATDAAAVAEVADLFAIAPRVVTNLQSGGGHNLSLGHAAAAYHRDTLSFARECAALRGGTGTDGDFTMEAS